MGVVSRGRESDKSPGKISMILLPTVKPIKQRYNLSPKITDHLKTHEDRNKIQSREELLIESVSDVDSTSEFNFGVRGMYPLKPLQLPCIHIQKKVQRGGCGGNAFSSQNLDLSMQVKYLGELQNSRRRNQGLYRSALLDLHTVK